MRVAALMALIVCGPVAAWAGPDLRSLRLMSGGLWPGDVELRVAGTGGARTATADIRTSQLEGARAVPGSGARAAAAARGATDREGTAKRSGTGAPSGELAELARQIAQTSREAIEVEQSGVDLVRMTARRSRATLRPLLLYLVQLGVLSRDEAEELSASESSIEPVLARLRARVDELASKRTTLEVRRILMDVKGDLK